MHFATRVRSSCVFRPSFFMQAAACKMRKEQFVLCIQLNVVNFALHPNPKTKSDEMRSGLLGDSALVTMQNDTCSYKLFFLY